VAIDPALVIVTVAVLVTLAILAIVVVPPILGRTGGQGDRDGIGSPDVADVRGGGVTAPPAEALAAGAPQRAYDRVVRIVAFTYLLTIFVVVAASGLWPATEPAIFLLLASAGIFVVVVHDLLPPDALGAAKPVVEGSFGITFAALLVLLTGQVESPFFLSFPLIVAGAALVVSPRAAVALAAIASLAFLAAALAPVDSQDLGATAVAIITIDLAALLLLTYVAMVVAREQRRARDAAIHLSTIDPLTGLFSRGFLFAAVEREIARSGRSERAFCLLMMDLDGLKAVNDRYGHLVGDSLLQAVGASIRDGVRRIDTPARYGGDEFVVLCPETDRSGARVLAEKIRQGVAAVTIVADGETVHPSVSVGAVSFPEDGSNADSLFDRADMAMYASKRAGKNRVMFAGAPVPVAVGIPVEPQPTAIEIDDAVRDRTPEASGSGGGSGRPV
jgi:diguanylate cyclase (GGDEF)-like protein